MELDDPTQRRLAAYLRAHPVRPVRGAGVVRPAFQVNPGGLEPAPEFLLADVARTVWYVRWPLGMLRWESTVGLTRRGITVPAEPLLGDVDEPGIT